MIFHVSSSSNLGPINGPNNLWNSRKYSSKIKEFISKIETSKIHQKYTFPSKKAVFPKDLRVFQGLVSFLGPHFWDIWGPKEVSEWSINSRIFVSKYQEIRENNPRYFQEWSSLWSSIMQANIPIYHGKSL